MVLDAKDGPIENAEVRMIGHDGNDIIMAKTDASRQAEIRVLAGWGTYRSLLHTENRP